MDEYGLISGKIIKPFNREWQKESFSIHSNKMRNDFDENFQPFPYECFEVDLVNIKVRYVHINCYERLHKNMSDKEFNSIRSYYVKWIYPTSEFRSLKIFLQFCKRYFNEKTNLLIQKELMEVI